MFSLFADWSAQQQLLAIFAVVILPLFIFDLWVMIRDADKIPKMRSSAIWVGTWIALAMGFNLLILQKLGAAPAADFLTAYLVEWSLSVDNLVVFMVIFSYFHIPLRLQRRVLLWGIIAALAMRAVIIVTGSFLIAYFNWIFYIFGVILLISAYKMARGGDEAEDFDQKLIIRLCRRFLPFTNELHGQRFSIKQHGRRVFTPMALALVLVEFADLVFAVDSIAAVFAITLDPFIVFTSNAMAVLGLRSLYFLIAGLLPKIRYLHYGLAVLLAYIGLKIMIQHATGHEWPTWLTLSMIGGTIGLSVLASVLRPAPAGDSH